MNCHQAQSVIDDYLDGVLEAGQVQVLVNHLDGCGPCQQTLCAEEQLRNTLRALPVPSPAKGFAERVLQRAVAENVRRRHRSAFIKGFGSAIAAGLALWLVIGIMPFPGNQSNISPTNEISIALFEIQRVKLAFHTTRQIEGATISIRLPENIVLVGFEGRREVVWQTNLLMGDNVLTLPLKALAGQGGELIAQIKHDNRVRTIKINIAVGRAGATESRVDLLTVV